MSINVTVTGNPVSITNKRMVSQDAYQQKKEFDKRRLIRLEQVRQQSKEIAKDVRDNVRKEKEKQLSRIEKEGEAKLRSWQNRKLLELQTQYKDALEEIGVGHKDAEEVVREELETAKEKEKYDELANQRAKEAQQQLQIKKNEMNRTLMKPIQQKKITREIENVRASMISKLNNKSAKAKPTKPPTEINVSIGDSICDSSSKENLISTNGKNIEEMNFPNESSGTDEVILEERRNVSPNGSESNRSNESVVQTQVDRIPAKETIKIDDEILERPKCKTFFDTRISDRIRRRELMKNQPDYCEIVAETIPVSITESIRDVRDAIYLRNSVKCKCYCCQNESSENGTCPGISCAKYSKQAKLSCCCPCDKITVIKSPKKVPSKQSKSIEIDSDGENLILDELESKQSRKTKTRTSTSDQRTSKTIEKNLDKRKSPKDVPSKQTEEYSKQSKTVEMDSDGENLIPNELESKQSAKTKTSISDQRTSKTIQANLDKQKISTSDPKPKRSTKQINLPEKPKVKLKQKNDASTFASLDSSKVKFYDHHNRFSANKFVPNASFVEKIDEKDIELASSEPSDLDVTEKMRRRDKEAQIRGRKAMEKEKVKRDYKEMMEKLPLLQKQERISKIYTDKPEYHMTEERLKELERKRQNQLENEFLKRFPNLESKIVTLPKVTEKEKIPDDCTPTHNRGYWQEATSDPNKLFTADEVQHIIKAFTQQTPKDRKTKLKELLHSLKVQKKQLIDEIKALPKDNSLSQILNEIRDIDDSDFTSRDKYNEKCNKKIKHKKKVDLTEEISVDNSSEESSSSRELKSGTESKKRVTKIVKEKVLPPKKKQRTRSKQKVLVLQNMSTQTTPKVSDREIPKVEIKPPEVVKVKPVVETICKKVHIPCDCRELCENKDEVEILIKIKDDEDPEVIVKNQQRTDLEPTKIDSSSKSQDVEVQVDIIKTDQKVEDVKSTESKTDSNVEEVVFKKPKPVQREKRKVEKVKKSVGREERSRSWKEQFSKNTSSSTSYLSPPEISGTRIDSSNETLESFYNLHKKPQQRNMSKSNITQSSKTEKPNLEDYITKLLSMSRGSIEELGVSSSTISTPSQSIVEMESNNPMAQIHNLIRYINQNQCNLPKELSLQESASSCTPCSNLNISVDAEKSSTLKQNSTVDTSSSLKEKSVKEVQDKKFYTKQYQDITDSCSKRIQNLTEMINKLREDKNKLIESTTNSEDTKGSDKDKEDYSTAYLEVPHPTPKESSEESLNEDELNKKLLEIDMSLANKLRKFSPPKNIQKVVPPSECVCEVNEDIVDSKNTTDDDQITQRLESLMKNTSEIEQKFVSFLSDIPKLPAFPDSGLTVVEENGHKKPPISKGLTIAKKFNNISLIPHELSTIVEAESQLSTKADQSLNSSKSKMEKSIASDSESSATALDNEPKVQFSEDLKISKEDFKSLTEISSNSKSILTHSSESSDDLESIEAMLKSIGMEWAIATLHKTKEALALSSSTSSVDSSERKKLEELKGSLSNISLADLLKRQLVNKISSSTLLASSSPSSLLMDFLDVSAIQKMSPMVEQGNQRTSTPVLLKHSTSNSKESFNQGFSGVSDLSSVKMSSTEEQGKPAHVSFHSLPSDESESQFEL